MWFGTIVPNESTDGILVPSYGTFHSADRLDTCSRGYLLQSTSAVFLGIPISRKDLVHDLSMNVG